MTNKNQEVEGVAKQEDVFNKDFYDRLCVCRDFEINGLWQRSIFLTAFITLTFSAYFFFVGKIMDFDVIPNTCHYISIFIALVGIVFSTLWIMMAKGSKAWHSYYENAIELFHKKCIEKDDTARNSKIDALKTFEEEIKESLLKNGNKACELNNGLFNTNPGAFSVSRINIMIGQVILVIWSLILITHLFLVCDSFIDSNIILVIILRIMVIFILVICFCIMPKCKSYFFDLRMKSKKNK